MAAVFRPGLITLWILFQPSHELWAVYTRMTLKSTSRLISAWLRRITSDTIHRRSAWAILAKFLQIRDSSPLPTERWKYWDVLVLSRYPVMILVWFSGAVVRASDLWSTGRELDSRSCAVALVLGWVTVCVRVNHLRM